jgi:hypothetical protein
MSELDSVKGDAAFPATRPIKDALGNARLSRHREIHGHTPPPDVQTVPTWEFLKIPPG